MLWVKAFHLLFGMSWFAGLFYLPRIFVNLAKTTDSAVYRHPTGIGRRLFRFMTLLAVAAVLLGLWLYLGYGLGRGQGWMHAKLFCVLLIAGYHHGCGRLLKKFEAGRNTRGHRFYRWFNELPVFLLLAVLILVVVRPF